MFLATVTCNRDFHQMLLQAESIQKFLEPCEHIIIVNEDNPDFDFWYRWLQPYYTKHSLKILPRIKYNYPIAALGLANMGNFDDRGHGWRHQQLQKMLLAFEYKEDYLLLDSKNFFIRNASLENYNNIIGHGSYTKTVDNAPYDNTVQNYVKVFGHVPKYFFKPKTPFKIVSKHITTNCDIPSLAYKLFYPHFNHSPASEFIFYSFLLNDDDWDACTFVNDYTLWDMHYPDLEPHIVKMTNEKEFLTSGVHRLLLSKLTDKEFNMINAWIKIKFGFKNKILPMPRDSYM